MAANRIIRCQIKDFRLKNATGFFWQNFFRFLQKAIDKELKL